MIWGIVRAWLASKDINVCILHIQKKKKLRKKQAPTRPSADNRNISLSKS